MGKLHFCYAFEPVLGDAQAYWVGTVEEDIPFVLCYQTISSLGGHFYVVVSIIRKGWKLF